MKITCAREPLLAAVQIVNQAISPRATRIILRNIKATANGGMLTLLGTDNEVSIRYDIENVVVDRPGEAIFPNGHLIPILRESRDEQLEIEATDSKFSIQGFSSEFEMPNEAVKDFPDVDVDASDDYTALTSGAFRLMNRRSTFAASDSEEKYATGGVLWEVADGKIKLVATDTRKLSVCETKTDKFFPTDPSITHLIQVRAMNLLEKNSWS